MHQAVLKNESIRDPGGFRHSLGVIFSRLSPECRGQRCALESESAREQTSLLARRKATHLRAPFLSKIHSGKKRRNEEILYGGGRSAFCTLFYIYICIGYSKGFDI